MYLKIIAFMANKSVSVFFMERMVEIMAIAKLSSEKKISVEIVKDFGALSEDAEGWVKHLTIADWGKGEKYDLRSWKDFGTEEQRCSKGITLNSEELEKLLEILKGMEA